MSQSRPLRLVLSAETHVHRDWSPEERSNDHADRINAAWVDIQTPLIAFLSRLLESQEDVRDVAQDTYVRLLTFADPATIRDLRNFAFTVAKNIAKHRQQDRATRLRLARSFLEDQQSLQTLNERRSPEQLCAAQEELEAIMLAFDELPAETKLIFAADLQGESVSSVAARLGLPPRVVYRQVARVRERLQQVFGRLRRVR